MDIDHFERARWVQEISSINQRLSSEQGEG
jgi:hypothetical protein